MRLNENEMPTMRNVILKLINRQIIEEYNLNFDVLKFILRPHVQ